MNKLIDDLQFSLGLIKAFNGPAAGPPREKIYSKNRETAGRISIDSADSFDFVSLRNLG